MTTEELTNLRTCLACKLAQYASDMSFKMKLGDPCGLVMRANYILAFHMFDLLCSLNSCQNQVIQLCDYEAPTPIVLNQSSIKKIKCVDYTVTPNTIIDTTDISFISGEAIMTQLNVVANTSYGAMFSEYDKMFKYTTTISYKDLLNNDTDCGSGLDVIYFAGKGIVENISGDYLISNQPILTSSYFYSFKVMDDYNGDGLLRITKIYTDNITPSEVTDIFTTISTKIKFIANPCEKNLTVKVYSKTVLLATTTVSYDFSEDYVILPVLQECGGIDRPANFTYNSITKSNIVENALNTGFCKCCLSEEETITIIDEIETILN